MKAEIITACSQNEKPLWGASFYPHDLPEDWQLDYYSNEFSGLFLSSAKLLNEHFLSELEECISEDFQLFIAIDHNLSLADVRTRLSENNALSIIGLSSFVPVERFPALSIAESIDGGTDVQQCYFYQCDKLLEPKALRTLAEFILDNNNQSDGRIYLFFSNSQYTVENCRNMQLLVQML